MSIVVIESAPWMFALMRDGDAYFITYMVGENSKEPITVKLTDNDVEELNMGKVVPFQLAERFRRHPEKFRDRLVNPPIPHPDHGA